jgi:hypothetical protein
MTYDVVVVLRCTARLLKLVGPRPGDLVRAEPAADDWYANLLWLDRRKCLLLAHASTLFSVFVPGVRKSDLVPTGPVVMSLIQEELRAESLPLDCLGVLAPSSVEIARTASRVVLGYMNEMGWYCKYAVAAHGGLDCCNAVQLNRELRRELHQSRQPPGYFVPIELAQGQATRNVEVGVRPNLRFAE